MTKNNCPYCNETCRCKICVTKIVQIEKEAEERIRNL
jgi:hypothetical protein